MDQGRSGVGSTLNLQNNLISPSYCYSSIFFCYFTMQRFVEISGFIGKILLEVFRQTYLTHCQLRPRQDNSLLRDKQHQLFQLEKFKQQVTKMNSNRGIIQRVKMYEASIKRIKITNNFGQGLSLKIGKKCGQKSLFLPRSERCLKNICLENR